jgi:uncharacterized surface protein with fasciclin (FAS1) repeats
LPKQYGDQHHNRKDIAMTYTYAKKLAWLFTASTLAFVIAACSSGQENQNFTASSVGPNSYVDGALADQGDLTMFYQALLTTGVANELNNNTEYTIFAPTNAAFAQVNPHAFPCFYAAQCRPQVAAVLRNHIVPRNENVDRFSKWGGEIATLGNRRIDVEEPYKGSYTVEGYRVLYQNEMSGSNPTRGNKVTLYHIDGVIANDREMAVFRTVPFANAPAAVMKKTVTTYHRPMGVAYPRQSLIPNPYLVPGGYVTAPAFYADQRDESSDDITETTTVTRRTTAK